MSGTARYFGRRYRLTFDSPEGSSVTFETKDGEPAMDIKFDVTYARGQTAREGTISILGLSFDTMQHFLKLAGITRGDAMSRMVHVRLEAGYFSPAGMVQILDGYVWYATITSPPNMWLNIKVCEYNPRGGKKIAVGTCTSRMPDAVRSFVQRFSGEDGEGEGITFEVVDETEDGIFDSSDKIITISGGEYTIGSAIKHLNDSVSSDVQFVLSTSNDDGGIRTIIALDRDKFKSSRGEVLVDGDHGLLSVTGIDAVNGCITTFIDGKWKDSLSHLVLTSELNPQANGRYYICKKQFVGHYRGQEWYVRYTCTAKEGDGEE